MEHDEYKCKICLQTKTRIEFPKQSGSTNAIRPNCKRCVSIARKQYRKRPEVAAKDAAYRATRKITEAQRVQYSLGRKTEEGKARKRELNKTQKYIDKRKEYLSRPDVRERVLVLRNKRYAEKEKTLAFKFDSRLRVLIRRSASTGKNNRSWHDLVDFTIMEFQEHFGRQFTKGMNWDEFKAGKIHIDHIVPMTDFNITSFDCPEFKACWSLGNLRPMWSDANNEKRAKRLFLL